MAVNAVRTLRSDRRAIVALTTAVGLVPLMIGVGVGVDTARLALSKAALQDALDGAALAGAAAYQTPGSTAAASQAAHAFFDRASATASGAFTVSSIVATPAPGVNAYGQSSYTVTVTAQATMATTFMGLAGIQSLALQGHAMAANPVAQPVISLGSVGSDAADWNSVYMYPVPMANGQPNIGAFAPVSQWYEVGSNCGPGTSNWTIRAMCTGMTGAVAPAAQTFPQVAANQPLAFVLQNVRRGTDPAGQPNESANSYGAAAGNFELLLTAPASIGLSPSYFTDSSQQIMLQTRGYYPQQPSTHYSQTNNMNCALIIQQVDPNNLPKAPPISGSCYAVDDPRAGLQYANLSCAQIAGRTFMYWWNDMGGYTDDVDYNDFYYTISCGGGMAGPNGGTFSQASGSHDGVALVQ